jgi:hypothetical protein
MIGIVRLPAGVLLCRTVSVSWPGVVLRSARVRPVASLIRRPLQRSRWMRKRSCRLPGQVRRAWSSAGRSQSLLVGVVRGGVMLRIGSGAGWPKWLVIREMRSR